MTVPTAPQEPAPTFLGIDVAKGPKPDWMSPCAPPGPPGRWTVPQTETGVADLVARLQPLAPR